jgi:hypothetical protein
MPDFNLNSGSFAEADLKGPSLKILEGLRRCGAMGAVGVDFVTCDEYGPTGEKVRKAYAIENNVRHTGTMYPYRTFFYLVGKEIMDNRYFMSTDSVKVKAISDEQAPQVRKWFYLDYLPNNPYVYNPLTQSGCLIYIDTWGLEKLGIACIGSTDKEVNELFEGFKASITKDVGKYVSHLK